MTETKREKHHFLLPKKKRPKNALRSLRDNRKNLIPPSRIVMLY